MMTSSNGNIFRVTGPLCGEFTGPGEFPAQKPVTRSFDVNFDLRLNKRLSKQPWGWWFETLSWSLWRHCNVLELWYGDHVPFIYTVYPKKYAHGFVVLCFVVVMQSFIMNSHEVFIHIHQGCFAGTGAIVRLPQYQWSKPDGYGKISQCITTTKHSKANTVCIFLGIYCTFIQKYIYTYIWYFGGCRNCMNLEKCPFLVPDMNSPLCHSICRLPAQCTIFSNHTTNPWFNFTTANYRDPSWINNYIHYTVYDEIRNPFPNFSSPAVEVWK